jgi:hypothetical protein
MQGSFLPWASKDRDAVITNRFWLFAASQAVGGKDDVN